VLTGRLRERLGVDVQAMHTDDGIIVRLPETDETPPPDIAVFEADEVEPLVTDEVGGSALFGSRFRECAARALLLPRRNPGKRTPLWQQRQRSAQLLAVASQYGSFPIVLETMRECLQDVFDVPGLTQLMRDVAARTVRIVDVETQQPSPMARSLLFGYIGQFMYEGDQPLAERRAAALTLDTTLLAELLGTAELRELLDGDAVDEIEAEQQRLTEDRRATDIEGVADLLRLLGDLTTVEAVARGATPQQLAELQEQRRAIRVRVGGDERWIAIEDASRLRDALGTPLPVGVPQAFLESVADPLGDLVSRFARTHGPFHGIDVAARFGLGLAVVEHALHRLAVTGRVVQGEFRPGGAGLEWCDADVLRAMRRRSLAKLRKEVEPAPPQALARFLPAWQGVGLHAGRGLDGLVRAIEQLQGAAVPASMLESVVLPSRVADYSPAMLDELTSSGEVLWVGQGSLPGHDGWVALFLADTAPLLMSPVDDDIALTPLHDEVRETLGGSGALFFRTLSDRLASLDDRALVDALWGLVWAGVVTNDTLAPLRVVVGGTGRRNAATRARSGRRGRPVMPARSGPPTAAGRWSLLPDREPDPTRRAHAAAEALLDRHGILTRGAVMAEHIAGGFAAVYPVLKAFEETGRCRRGYFVEGLGGAQFAMPGAVDRMRALALPAREASPWQPPVPGGWRDRRRREDTGALVLAATDPANPYGAALPWPERPAEHGAHRPGRKAGALVVLVDGELTLYVERGGKSLLSCSDDPACVQPAADALALAIRDGMLGRLAVERADGAAVLSSPLGAALEAAGFRPTPRGLRLRA
jgi:ATP-dependent helicase Lhr and Lhr-like helicase